MTTSLPLRPQVGAWRLLAPAGEGGMAVVWRVAHCVTGQVGALKAIRPQRHSPTYLALFQQEIRAVAGLDHPGVVKIFDHGVVQPAEAVAGEHALVAGSPWLVMEWLEGGTLSQRLGRQPWETQQRLLLGLLDALAHAHARGVIHRDLKPSNVLLDGEGRPKLADFGLAVPLRRIGAAPEPAHADGPRRTAITGTPSYMAPEQVRGDWRRMGPWTDLYALGGLAWAMATGAPPFSSTADTELLLQAQCSWPLPALRPTQPVPEALGSWLARLLEKPPGARFLFAADAAWALAQLGTAPGGAPPGPPGPAPRLPTFTFFDDASLTLDETLDETLEPRAPAPLPMPAGRAPMPPRWQPREAAPAEGGHLKLMALRRPRMLGRDAEQALLWRALRQVCEEGSGRAVVLRGPDGLGKSSLARWISERAHELGLATPLEAWHHPEPQGGHGLAGLVARATRCFGLDLPGSRARLRSWLGGLGEQDPLLVEGLSRLVADPDHPPRSQAAREDTLRFIEALAKVRPVLLQLDDVQWGEPSIELAAALLRRPNVPVLIVLTADEESLDERATAARQLAALAEQPKVEVCALTHLTAEATLAQLRALSGLQEAEAQRLAARVSGDPLAATELLRVGSAEGWLRETAEGVTLALHAPLPQDSDALWRRGLDLAVEGLGEDGERALALAALLGEWVSPALWRPACEALGVQPAQEPLLSRLLDAGLATRAPHQQGWSWRHARVRAAALDRVEPSARPAMHAACAQALRTQPGPEALAQRGAHEVASGQLALGLETLLSAFDGLFEAERASEMRPVIARAREAVTPGTPPALVAELRLREARHALSEARWEDALSLAAALEEEARGAGWRALEVKALMVTAGVRSATRVDAEVERLARRILARSEGLDDARVRAYASYTAGRLLSYLGHTADARRALEEAERLSEATGLLRQGTYARCQLGYRDLVDGHLAQARARLNAGRALSDEHGFRLMAVWSRCLLAVAELLDGRSAQSIALLEEALDRCTLTLAALRLAAWLDLGWALIEHGDLDRAREVLTTCRDQSAALGASSYANLAALELAVCDAETGDWPQAREDLPGILDALEGAAVVELNEPILLRRLSRSAHAVGDSLLHRRLTELAEAREARLRG